MERTDPILVAELRRMGREGQPPAMMLHEIIRFLGPRVPHKLTLIAHMRDAFRLSLAEASPIAGWSSEAPAELSDTQLNGLLSPIIQRNREQWEREQDETKRGRI